MTERKAPAPAAHLSHRQLVTGAILLAGWSVAVAVYLTAEPVVPDEEISGEIYDMQHSRTYLRQVELIGGKAAVFTTELNEWLSGLWHGKPLAYTIAFFTTVVALAYYAMQRPGKDHGPTL